MKRYFVRALVLIALAGTIQPAMADQCMYLDTKDVADRAAGILTAAKTIQSFCAPCGDSAPEFLRKGSISVGNDEWGHYVKMNGDILDLAYTYVDGKNLAKLAGCAANDVPDSIQD